MEIQNTNNIVSPIKEFLRRANNCDCECGICATCLSDTDYFKIVADHYYKNCEQCVCNVCSDYNTNLHEITMSNKCIDNIYYDDNKTNLHKIIYYKPFTKSINPKVRVFLRHANNCNCKCGICATCVSDYEYFKIISEHIEQVETCDCKFCTSYRDYHIRFN